MLDNGRLGLILDNDHFSAARPITVKSDLASVDFSLESGNPAAHTATLRLSASASGPYTFRDANGVIATVNLAGGREVVVPLPMEGGSRSFTIARK